MGARIRFLVKRFDSDVQAAAIAGVTVATIANYEKGTVAPRIEPLARLASHAGVNLHWLATGKGPRLIEGQPVTEMYAGRDDGYGLTERDVALVARLAPEVPAAVPIAFSSSWLDHQCDGDRSRLAVFVVTDNGLVPQVRRDDVLLIERLEGEERFSTSVYLAKTKTGYFLGYLARDGERLVLQRTASEDGVLQIPWEPKRNVIGVVIWRGGRGGLSRP